MDDDNALDIEIKRVRFEILEYLRKKAYTGGGRTSKAEIGDRVCTSTDLLDQNLRYLADHGFVDGVLSGNMKITAAGEREFEEWQRTRKVAYEEGRLQGTLMTQETKETSFDVFISHASEDKDAFVRPLAEALRTKGLRVWYDEFSLKLGDSLRQAIDEGLAKSRFGIVVLSHNFFSKKWSQQELNGLFATMRSEQKRILPIWHQLTADEVAQYSPVIADLVAARSEEGVDAVVQKILEVVR